MGAAANSGVRLSRTVPIDRVAMQGLVISRARQLCINRQTNCNPRRERAASVANQGRRLVFRLSATKAASATIPIIFVIGSDPVRSGLVASMNLPGGNITGVTFTTVDVTAKRLGQLHELIPAAELIGVLVDPNSPESDLEVRDAKAAATSIGRRVLAVKAASPHQFGSAFATLVRAGIGALLVGSGPFFTSQRARLAVLSARHAIPTSYTERAYALAGGLMSYGPSQTDAYRRAGIYAARILRGERAGDLPVDQPTKFELVINLGTAAALGITIPSAMQLIADEVIE
jgi:putative ABC transport system substrate-binding protein